LALAARLAAQASQGRAEPTPGEGREEVTASDLAPAESPPRPAPLRAYGPFALRSIDSLSLLFYQAPLSSASTLSSGSWRFSVDLQYAAHENGGMEDGFFATHDQEILRWEMWGNYGITDDLELVFSLPFHYSSSGFLDDFIDEFHDVTGLGPTDNHNEQYADTLRFAGREFAGLPEDRLALADIPIALKYALWKDGRDPLGVALRAGIELPTGDPSDGFGSGRIDGGAGILLEKSAGDFSFYLGVDGSFQDTPSAFQKAGVEVRPAVLNAGFAIEWRMFDWLAWVTQINYADPLLDDGATRILRLDRVHWSIGGHVGLGDCAALRFGLVEDVVTGPVADVAFLLGLSVDW
jgi:hypothetical protein